MFVRNSFSSLFDVKHFSAKIIATVAFFALFSQALYWLLRFFVSNQNDFRFRSNSGVNDRQTSHLDASTTYVCHQKNSISSFRLWFWFFLSTLFLDDTDALIQHDSSLHPSHLCLFSEDGRRWVSQAWTRPNEPRPVSWEWQWGTFNLVCFRFLCPVPSEEPVCLPSPACPRQKGKCGYCVCISNTKITMACPKVSVV